MRTESHDKSNNGMVPKYRKWVYAQIIFSPKMHLEVSLLIIPHTYTKFSSFCFSKKRLLITIQPSLIKPKPHSFLEGTNPNLTSYCIHLQSWNLELVIFFLHPTLSLWSVISQLHHKVNYMYLESTAAAGLRVGDSIYAVIFIWTSPWTSCLS